MMWLILVVLTKDPRALDFLLLTLCNKSIHKRSFRPVCAFHNSIFKEKQELLLSEEKVSLFRANGTEV